MGWFGENHASGLNLGTNYPFITLVLLKNWFRVTTFKLTIQFSRIHCVVSLRTAVVELVDEKKRECRQGQCVFIDSPQIFSMVSFWSICQTL